MRSLEKGPIDLLALILAYPLNNCNLTMAVQEVSSILVHRNKE